MKSPRPSAYGIYSMKTDELLGIARISHGGRTLVLPKDISIGVHRWFDELRETGIDTRVGCSQTGGAPFAHVKAGDARFWEIVMCDARHPDYYIKPQVSRTQRRSRSV